METAVRRHHRRFNHRNVDSENGDDGESRHLDARFNRKKEEHMKIHQDITIPWNPNPHHHSIASDKNNRNYLHQHRIDRTKDTEQHFPAKYSRNKLENEESSGERDPSRRAVNSDATSKKRKRTTQKDDAPPQKKNTNFKVMNREEVTSKSMSKNRRDNSNNDGYAIGNTTKSNAITSTSNKHRHRNTFKRIRDVDHFPTPKFKQKETRKCIEMNKNCENLSKREKKEIETNKTWKGYEGNKGLCKSNLYYTEENEKSTGLKNSNEQGYTSDLIDRMERRGSGSLPSGEKILEQDAQRGEKSESDVISNSMNLVGCDAFKVEEAGFPRNRLSQPESVIHHLLVDQLHYMVKNLNYVPPKLSTKSDLCVQKQNIEIFGAQNACPREEYHNFRNFRSSSTYNGISCSESKEEKERTSYQSLCLMENENSNNDCLCSMMNEHINQEKCAITGKGNMIRSKGEMFINIKEPNPISPIYENVEPSNDEFSKEFSHKKIQHREKIESIIKKKANKSRNVLVKSRRNMSTSKATIIVPCEKDKRIHANIKENQPGVFSLDKNKNTKIKKHLCTEKVQLNTSRKKKMSKSQTICNKLYSNNPSLATSTSFSERCPLSNSDVCKSRAHSNSSKSSICSEKSGSNVHSDAFDNIVQSESFESDVSTSYNRSISESSSNFSDTSSNETVQSKIAVKVRKLKVKAVDKTKPRINFKRKRLQSENSDQKEIQVGVDRKSDEAPRMLSRIRTLTAAELRDISDNTRTSEDITSTTWVRRSTRQPYRSGVDSVQFRSLVDKLKMSDPDMLVLKLKKYMSDPDTPCVVIDAMLDALAGNTNCQALYIQVSIT